jgi:hypothetical protein
VKKYFSSNKEFEIYNASFIFGKVEYNPFNQTFIFA